MRMLMVMLLLAGMTGMVVAEEAAPGKQVAPGDIPPATEAECKTMTGQRLFGSFIVVSILPNREEAGQVIVRAAYDFGEGKREFQTRVKADNKRGERFIRLECAMRSAEETAMKFKKGQEINLAGTIETVIDDPQDDHDLVVLRTVWLKAVKISLVK